ncbi:MAG: hypothetical protein QM730_01500 [Anaerolineales bacterium]
MRARLRFFLPILAILFLAACGNRGTISYRGTCSQQTQQFMDYIHSFVVEKLNPVIQDGVRSDSYDVMNNMETLDARASEINIPACNAAKADAVKEALRQYMLETKNYFSTIAGRDVYGEGPVQGQLSKMNEAGFALEAALEDLQK